MAQQPTSSKGVPPAQATASLLGSSSAFAALTAPMLLNQQLNPAFSFQGTTLAGRGPLPTPPGPTFFGFNTFNPFGLGPYNPNVTNPAFQIPNRIPKSVGPLQNIQNPPKPSGTRQSSGPAVGVTQLKNKISKLGGFARNNLFIVDVYLPARWFKYKGAASSSKNERQHYMRFLARGVTLPGSQISAIDVPYRGQMYKMPGERIYEPITVTFMNDQRHTIRNTFFDWHKMLRDHDNNYMWNDDPDNVNFYGDLEISCLYRDKWNKNKNRHQISSRIRFHRAFPTIIGAIELDSGTNDQIQEFTVQFEYQRMEFKERGDDNSGLS